ncbi:putative acetyltransferase [Rhizobium azibense]|uniref:Putative acetyltransferase n=1 Tax=Rhizobium azibense TaxID=1136135 RepID=A0A4R3RPB0_9HYPH|nr:N-acetyltransferase [Rhizobium azibense]TCU29118.1 putative acetyltransferase [Rhizobium azibense]TCU37760.1 putative acetyltransferase [Rhizobium azibense]
MRIRNETIADIPAIRALISTAFAAKDHSSQTEAAIVDALRRNRALSATLVAEDEGQIVGHIAFSPVMINRRDLGWYGLGPLAVTPERQGEGIGTRLVKDGLGAILKLGAQGCVLLGDPGYYGRFGFKADARLRLADYPAEYFQALCFSGEMPSGMVTYDAAFDLTNDEASRHGP